MFALPMGEKELGLFLAGECGREPSKANRGGTHARPMPQGWGVGKCTGESSGACASRGALLLQLSKLGLLSKILLGFLEILPSPEFLILAYADAKL